MASKGEFSFFNLEPDAVDIKAEVVKGLTSKPKHISPKYFYDSTGAALFEQITELDEYYLTRTEMALLKRHLPEIAAIVGPESALVEFGGGSSRKVRQVLETLAPRAYVPVDISQAHLLENAEALHRDFPALSVYPVCADFSQPLTLPEPVAGLRRVGFFPGSSIGNFSPAGVVTFLTNVREELGQDGALLVGVDRKKDEDTLVKAYNDAAGVTAEFNLNVLKHINRTLNANFDLQRFSHDARYNAQQGCIQMFLRSHQQQAVSVAGVTITLAAGEEIHTENSYKYHPQEFIDLANKAGFGETRVWTDERDLFAIYLLLGSSLDI